MFARKNMGLYYYIFGFISSQSLFIKAAFHCTASHPIRMEAKLSTLWPRKEITCTFFTSLYSRILYVCLHARLTALPLISHRIYTLERLRTSIHHHQWLKFPTLKGRLLYKSYETCLWMCILMPTLNVSQSRCVISVFEPEEMLIWQTAHSRSTLRHTILTIGQTEDT